MSTKLNGLYAISVVLIVTLSSVVFAADSHYEKAATQLQQRLGNLLMSTIKTQGHVAAIAVCNEQAPEIAKAVSSELDLAVGRTSLKVRNPDNTATPRQAEVLREFEWQWQQTQQQVPDTQFKNEKGKTVWMKAIVMQPQCVACHGTAVSGELKQAIDSKYPNDQATGFEVGDIRGAFVISER